MVRGVLVKGGVWKEKCVEMEVCGEEGLRNRNRRQHQWFQ